MPTMMTLAAMRTLIPQYEWVNYFSSFPADLTDWFFRMVIIGGIDQTAFIEFMDKFATNRWVFNNEQGEFSQDLYDAWFAANWNPTI